MGKKVRKPIVIGNDSDTIVSLQIASVSVNGVQATPEVRIMFEDGEDNATVALLTGKSLFACFTLLNLLQ